MRRAAGFTLIEVLIAMMITAIASVMAYGGLDSAMKAKSRVEANADELRSMNRAFDILARDFRQIIGRTVRSPAGYGNEHAFMLDEMALPMLSFSRAGWTNPVPERFVRSQLQRVAYHYDGDKLTRYSWLMMDRYEDSKTRELVLFEDVTAFRVRVMQPPDVSSLDNIGPNIIINLQDSNSDQWVERWPPLEYGQKASASSVLPVAVEVTLTLKNKGEFRRVFELAGGESL